jgi:hypothetical protein
MTTTTEPLVIERTRTVTVTALSDSIAKAHARKVLVIPDERWTRSEPVVTARRGTQRTVKVTFRLVKEA